MCPHLPACPPADRRDRDAARTVASHPEQGWSLLCNGVIVFEDTGELLPLCSDNNCESDDTHEGERRSTSHREPELLPCKKHPLANGPQSFRHH